jgi:hypothetical protein
MSCPNAADGAAQRDMLPEADHSPPCCPQARVRSVIAFSVLADLRCPPGAICARNVAMSRAAMPEATVEEDS